jgi:hypothetical protein
MSQCKPVTSSEAFDPACSASSPPLLAGAAAGTRVRAEFRTRVCSEESAPRLRPSALSCDISACNRLQPPIKLVPPRSSFRGWGAEETHQWSEVQDSVYGAGPAPSWRYLLPSPQFAEFDHHSIAKVLTSSSAAAASWNKSQVPDFGRTLANVVLESWRADWLVEESPRRHTQRSEDLRW